nr:hypothetical protein HK105_001063 [Polyrhizophydium stewartii]
MLVHSHSRVSRQHAYGRRDSFGPADSQSSLLDDADFQDDDDDDEEDVRKCEWGDCSLEFDSKQELVAHVNDHIGSGRASYICEWRGCSRLLRPFTKRHKVQNHVRTHTKERPFVCTIEDCGKSFSRLDGLNTHIRTHSNIKPFVCSVPGCGKAYFHARSLRKHERSHTGADAEHLEMAAAAAAMVIPSSSLLDDDLTGGSDTSAPDSIIHVRQSHPQQQKQQQHLADPHMSFDLSYVPNGAGLRHGTAPNGDDASVSAAMAASGMFDAAMSPSSMYPGLLDHHHQHQQQQQQQAHFAQQHHDAHNLKMQQSMLASYDYAQASYRQQLAAAAAQHLPQQSLLIMPEPNGPLSLDMPVATAVDPRYTAWAAPSADI